MLNSKVLFFLIYIRVCALKPVKNVFSLCVPLLFYNFIYAIFYILDQPLIQVAQAPVIYLNILCYTLVYKLGLMGKCVYPA